MKLTLITAWLEKHDDPDNLLPPPMDAQQTVDYLAAYLLPQNWYIAFSASQEQANFVILNDILTKYSRRYRKEMRRWMKKASRASKN